MADWDAAPINNEDEWVGGDRPRDDFGDRGDANGAPPEPRDDRGPPSGPRGSHRGTTHPKNDQVSKCIGVFNLSIRTTEDDLKQEFGAIGPVEKVVVLYDHQTQRSRGFGFVTMFEEADAATAVKELDGIDLQGRNIRVDFSFTKGPHEPTPGRYMGQKDSRPRPPPPRDGPRGYGPPRDRGDRYDRYDRPPRRDDYYDRPPRRDRYDDYPPRGGGRDRDDYRRFDDRYSRRYEDDRPPRRYESDRGSSRRYDDEYDRRGPPTAPRSERSGGYRDDRRSPPPRRRDSHGDGGW